MENREIMKTHRAALVLTGVTILLLTTGVITKAMCPAKISQEQLDSLVGDLIEQNVVENKDKEVTLNGLYLDMAPLVYQFYTINDYQQVWTVEENGEVTDEVFRLLENSMQFGIDPEYFAVEYMKFLQKDIKEQCKPHKKAIRMAQFEFLMTHTVFQFYVMMEKGIQYYETVNFYDSTDIYLQNLPVEILQSIHKKDLVDSILDNHPKSNNYTNYISTTDQVFISVH